LKGAVFRTKMLSERRVRGLGALGFSALVYAKSASLALMMGPTLPMLGVVASAVYGARALNESGEISKIEYITEVGEQQGLLRATIKKSPFASYTIVMNCRNTMSLYAVGADDLGEDDAESNILFVGAYLNEETGKMEENGTFALPADAWRDRASMEWIMAQKADESETDALFNDLIVQKHSELASTGGIKGV
jgi:hypothetical protein